MKRILTVIAGITVLFYLAAGIVCAEERAPAITLQDQYDKMISLRQYEGHIVVLIASDKEGSAQNKAWAKAIREHYADRVIVQGIADVSSVPFFMKGVIRNDFKRDGESILLDWKGEVFKAFGFTKSVANIVLIDRDGIIRHRSSGSADPHAVEELFKKIDERK